MKKKIYYLIVCTIMCLFNAQAFAATTSAATTNTDWDSAAAQKRINDIGAVIISKNNLPNGITFKVSSDEDINAYANINKEVYIYKGLLQYVNNNEELAAVISHEIGHIINGHCAKQTILQTLVQTMFNKINTEHTTAKAISQDLAVTKLSRNDEFEADLTGVDLMVKANYNPLAMISVLNKICGNYIDILQTHPSGEKRLMNIYNYVDYNYNTKLKNGYNSESYKKALAIISLNVQKRNSSVKNQNKYKKQQEKLLTKKVKRANKMVKSSNIWDTSYATLMLMAN